MTFRRVLDAAELWPGEMRGVVVQGTKVLLANVDGRVVAFANRCAHQAVELHTGALEGCRLTCPAHHWEYDLRTGEGENPRAARLVPFPVRADDDGIYVDVESAADDAAWVGPVLRRTPQSTAIVEALVAENPHAKIVDRGSYVRVLAPTRCRLSRIVVERHAHEPFRLPSDLELIMVSFKGRLTMTDDEALWESADDR